MAYETHTATVVLPVHGEAPAIIPNIKPWFTSHYLTFEFAKEKLDEKGNWINAGQITPESGALTATASQDGISDCYMRDAQAYFGTSAISQGNTPPVTCGGVVKMFKINGLFSIHFKKDAGESEANTRYIATIAVHSNDN